MLADPEFDLVVARICPRIQTDFVAVSNERGQFLDDLYAELIALVGCFDSCTVNWTATGARSSVTRGEMFVNGVGFLQPDPFDSPDLAISMAAVDLWRYRLGASGLFESREARPRRRPETAGESVRRGLGAEGWSIG